MFLTLNNQNRFSVVQCLSTNWQSLANCSTVIDKDIDLAPVVQTLDSAFHRINHYPADKY